MTDELPALVELRTSLVNALVVEDWQRRCDASLVASSNKRESDTKPAPPLAILFAVLSFAWAVAVGLSTAYGHLDPRYSIPAIVVLIVGATYLGRPRARFA